MLAVLTVACIGITFQTVATWIDNVRFPPPGKMVNVEGVRLHIICSGEGAPPVLLDAGLGGYSLDWTIVQGEVSSVTRVCAYDRAGMGWSDPSPRPRNAGNIARELHALIKIAGISAPVILVGHSLAGFTARLYASYFPSEVAGVVLVDASVENAFDTPEFDRVFADRLLKFNRCRWEAPFGTMRIEDFFWRTATRQSLSELPARVQAEYAANRYRSCRCTTIYNEFTAIPDSIEQLRRSGYSLGSIPLVVIRHGRPTSDAADEEGFRLQQDRLARLSSNSIEIVAGRSSHMIPLEQPEVVTEAIRRLVDQARRSQK